MDDQEITNPLRKLSRPGAAAARSLRALAELRVVEERRREHFRLQLTELERTASLEQSRLRRIEREHRREQERRFARLLGRLALKSLTRQGMTGTLLTAVDVIGSLKADDLVDLKAFLQIESDQDRRGDHQSSNMDILLPIAE